MGGQRWLAKRLGVDGESQSHRAAVCAGPGRFQSLPEGARGVWALADTRDLHRLFFCCPHECVSVHQLDVSAGLAGHRGAAAAPP